jgi:hypothetical protein
MESKIRLEKTEEGSTVGCFGLLGCWVHDETDDETQCTDNE